MQENIKSGARPISKIRRKLRKAFRPSLARGFGFDWTMGFDVRDLTGPITIKDQGDNSSCGGQAGSYFLEVQRLLQGIKEGSLSAKSVYAPIAFKGGGTTIPMLEEQLGGAGANLESSVPSMSIYGNPLDESMMEEKSWITDTLLTDALTRAGYTPYDIPDDIDSVALAIKNHGAVIWEITGQNNGTWASPYPKPPSKTNKNEMWHHFMCCIGAKIINGKKTIIALQSMGEGYGEKGIQYFQEDYFDSGYIVDAFTLIYDKNLVPDPNNHSFWSEVLRIFRKHWGLS